MTLSRVVIRGPRRFVVAAWSAVLPNAIVPNENHKVSAN